MAMTPTGIARTVGLYTLIIAAIISAVIDFNHDNTVWGWAKIGIAALIVAFEIGRMIYKNETISTKYKRFIIKDRFWGYTSLFFFALALAGLILHLAVW